MKLHAWWMENGGQVTLDAFLAESEDTREDILDYLEEFALYEEVTAGGFAYVLVHAGIKNFDPQRELDKYGLNDLLFEKPDYSKTYYEDRILVTGHTPTGWIEGGTRGCVFRGNNHLAIDLSEDNMIAAVRLDDGEVFYVKDNAE
jgi:serine/threonine protein phosphatase 1